MVFFVSSRLRGLLSWRASGRGCEGMRKIEVIGFGEAQKEGRSSPDANPVPAHVRQLDARRQGANPPFEKRQAFEGASLLARAVECLQAEANAEKGNAPGNRPEQRSAQPAVVDPVLTDLLAARGVLSGKPPAGSFFRIGWIVEIDDHEDRSEITLLRRGDKRELALFRVFM